MILAAGALISQALLVAGSIIPAYFLLLLWATSRSKYAAAPNITWLPPELPDAPATVRKFFEQLPPLILQTGLELRGMTKFVNVLGNVSTYAAILEHPTDHAVAILAIVMVNLSGTWRRHADFIDCCTNAQDGRKFYTSNSRQARIWPPAPIAVNHRIPQQRDSARMYRFHRQLLKRAGALPLPGPRADNPVAFLEEEAVWPVRLLADAGWFRFDLAEGVYSPTLRGALGMALRLVAPVKQIRDYLQRRRGAELMALLDAEIAATSA